MSAFEKASRQKLRFVSPVGNVSTEDLWDLPLETLDAMAQALHKKVEEGATTSFINAPEPTKADRITKLRFEVIKSVIDTRLKDRETAEKAAATRAQKQSIMELIENKRKEKLADLSVEELEAML